MFNKVMDGLNKKRYKEFVTKLAIANQDLKKLQDERNFLQEFRDNFLKDANIFKLKLQSLEKQEIIIKYKDFLSLYEKTEKEYESERIDDLDFVFCKDRGEFIYGQTNRSPKYLTLKIKMAHLNEVSQEFDNNATVGNYVSTKRNLDKQELFAKEMMLGIEEVDKKIFKNLAIIKKCKKKLSTLNANNLTTEQEQLQF